MNNGIILNNRIIDLVFISALIAQCFKIFAPVFSKKRPAFSLLFETGGMPSSHSASVSSLCTSIAFIYGVNSVYFAISFVLATIVMYDATGIRREAGKHAKALNQLITENQKDIFETKQFKEFKEFLGHTPLEVFAGCILGIIVTFIFQGYLVWKKDLM